MAKTNPNDRANIQTSFRISTTTQAAIRSMAESMNISQSEIMRAAVTLYRHVDKLPSNLKLAVVDVKDKKDTSYFRVKSWIIAE